VIYEKLSRARARKDDTSVAFLAARELKIVNLSTYYLYNLDVFVQAGQYCIHNPIKNVVHITPTSICSCQELHSSIDRNAISSIAFHIQWNYYGVFIPDQT